MSKQAFQHDLRHKFQHMVRHGFAAVNGSQAPCERFTVVHNSSQVHPQLLKTNGIFTCGLSLLSLVLSPFPQDHALLAFCIV